MTRPRQPPQFDRDSAHDQQVPATESLYRECLPEISTEQVGRLQQFAALLREWNQRVNVISRKDTDSLEERHILHAILIARCVQFGSGARIMDIGTGGGLPGIPLAILFPAARFTLVDSIGKKIRAVSDMAGQLGLCNVETYRGRAEHLPASFDYITGRAVAPMPQLKNWIASKLVRGRNGTVHNGLLYLKGSRYDEECRALGMVPEHVWPLHDIISRPYFQEKYLIHIRAEGLIRKPRRSTQRGRRPNQDSSSTSTS